MMAQNLKIRNFTRMAFLGALTACLMPTTGFCVALTRATVEECINNEGGFNCIEKAVLTFPVSFGEAVLLDAVYVDEVMKEGEPTSLEENTGLEIEKTRPLVRYPLSFFHTVPYFPYEEAFCVENGDCDDAADSVAPSCGWTYQGSVRIEDSQGFCANTTAHCLRLGELYFHGYEIGRPARYFEINGTAKQGEVTKTFQLTPANQSASISEMDIKAALEGELGGYQDLPDLGNYILYVPASPDTHPFVQDYANNMLLVPREELARDGGDCDKVGVSFHTFRAQKTHGEHRDVGDCLHNQLFHKHNSDLQKLIMNADAETAYLVHGKKKFKGAMEFKQGMQKILEYHPAGTEEKSLVSIVMPLDSVKTVSTESPGIIVGASVEEFEAMSRNGTMVVEIQNMGDLKSDYVVTITECNMNIDHAIPQQSRTLEPGENDTLTFDVNTTYNLDISNECTATLSSTTGRQYDEVVVEFDTFKHQSRYSWDLQLKNEEGEDPECPETCQDASCIIAEACPCEDGDWKNHGQYVSCVSQAAESMLAAGDIGQAEKDAIVFEAGQSSCGRKK
jgi:hypothetical protein